MRAAKLKTFRAAAILAALSLVTVACGDSGDDDNTAAPGASESTRTVNMILNFSPNGMDCPVYTAKNKGYFEEEGLEVNIQAAQSSQDAINAVTSGRNEIGTASLVFLVPSQEKGLKTLSIGGRYGRHSYGLFLPKDAGTSDLKSLEGKTILAASAGIIDETKLVLAGEGVNVAKVKFATIAAAALLSTYAGGQGDAMATVIGLGSPIVQPKRPSEEIYFSDLGVQMPDYTYFVAPETAEKDPELITQFLTAAYRGFEACSADPKATAAAMAATLPGMDPNLAAAQWEAMEPFICSPAAPKDSAVSEQVDADWTEAGRVLNEIGLTKSVVNTSEMYTNDFADGVTDMTCPQPAA